MYTLLHPTSDPHSIAHTLEKIESHHIELGGHRDSISALKRPWPLPMLSDK